MKEECDGVFVVVEEVVVKSVKLINLKMCLV